MEGNGFSSWSTALSRYNSPDIIEDLGDVVYQGYFNACSDETEENNCLIIKIETIGNITTRKFAKGNNYSNTCTWRDRYNYEYSFGLKNI